MTLLGCKLSAWVKKIWIFSFWLFSDTPYCIVVKSQQNSKGDLLAKSGKLIFQRRSFLEGKIQKNGKKFFKNFYCSKTFVSKWFIKYLAHINIEHTITISLSVLLKINLFFLKFDKLTNTVLVQLLILTSSFCLYLKVRLIKFAHDVLAKQ